MKNVPYNLAFCFDNLKPSHDPKINAYDVITRIEGVFEDVLVPILHAPLKENKTRDYELLPDIFLEYASRKKSPFIAVPERELGEGICEKAKTIIKIRNKLKTLNYYQPIHLLGTGNPFSLLILAAAGADLFDGLEWCRTVVDRKTGFLFHHQHFDFFKHQTIQMSQYKIIKEAMKIDGPSLSLKIGLHNLDFFNEWMDEVQFSIHNNQVEKMILGRTRFESREFCDEISKLLPGMIK